MIEIPPEELDDQPVAPLVPLSFNRKFKISERKLNPQIALAEEIYKLWGLTVPHVMGLIKYKGYECVLQEFEQVKKSPCRNHAAVFQWRLGQIKPFKSNEH